MHTKKANRDYDKERGSSSSRGYDGRWQRYRVMYLREHPLCACGCGGLATDVDHIVPVTGPDDPLFWEPSNHQGLTHECHSRKTAMQNGRWQAAASTQVILVCGPPGAGKSTYVAEHLQPGDIRWDLDEIVQCITGLPMYQKPQVAVEVALDMREALYARLSKQSTIQRAWIIVGAPRAEHREQLCRRMNATALVLDTPASVCIERIRSDPRRRRDVDEWITLVHKWWQDYEAGSG